MKRWIFVMMLLVSTSVLAEDLNCTVSVNMEVVAEEVFTVAPKTKVTYVNAADFVFYVANKGNSKFELEIFNVDAPSRSYATGFLRTNEDALTCTLWTNDYLLETSCRLADK